MSFFRFKLEAVALLMLAVVCLRAKARFAGRSPWLFYAHVALLGTVVFMAVGGGRMFLHLCLKPNQFFEVFVQQRLFAIEPRLMLTYGVVFTLTSVWLILNVDDFCHLRKRPGPAGKM